MLLGLIVEWWEPQHTERSFRRSGQFGQQSNIYSPDIPSPGSRSNSWERKQVRLPKARQGRLWVVVKNTLCIKVRELQPVHVLLLVHSKICSFNLCFLVLINWSGLLMLGQKPFHCTKAFKYDEEECNAIYLHPVRTILSQCWCPLAEESLVSACVPTTDRLLQPRTFASAQHNVLLKFIMNAYILGLNRDVEIFVSKLV